MTIFTKVPTHIDYAHRMAEIAAEMAGYDLTELENRTIDRDETKSALYRSFVHKGFEAINVLGPALVTLDAGECEKVPAEVRNAGDERGYHALTTVRLWRGLSIEQLAEASGLSATLIRAIESREVVANEMHDNAMAKALNVSPHALTDWRVTCEWAATLDTRIDRGVELGTIKFADDDDGPRDQQ
ncbi:hypothetical protein ASE00_16305 [Sphingomonas sp. Root710]|uniref:helix-turn-helix domain-containing protein n=1 Tax=Sphingomonas sp. Root710 TaxID=1736594 RepID=UPI0006FD2DF3|nr:helix-turn-helix transcriptional regulator [Sphingomonas sp. Root710]KRB80609.1 hypothetical protein ASE00_16305 [Sphingomonas sp. Root710]